MELAQCYSWGIGVVDDDEEAVVWYQKAVYLGDKDVKQS
jgi:TPR repeat protein